MVGKRTAKIEEELQPLGGQLRNQELDCAGGLVDKEIKYCDAIIAKTQRAIPLLQSRADRAGQDLAR